MGVLNPIVSKFLVSQGNPQEIYFCPSSKSHAVVDLNFYKEDISNDPEIAVALTTESDPANITSTDYLIKNIKLIGSNNSAEVNKIIVGKDEHLYVKVISGPDVIIRLSGIEENNSKILKAGRLSASSLTNTDQNQIYENTLSNVAYISGSLSIYNTLQNQNAQIEAWITTSSTPSLSDKVLKVTVPTNTITVLENIFLTPNEKIFMKSSIPNIEYFFNGAVVSQ